MSETNTKKSNEPKNNNKHARKVIPWSKFTPLMKNLFFARLDTGMSYRMLSEKTNIPQSRLSKIGLGKERSRADLLVLSEFFHCDPKVFENNDLHPGREEPKLVNVAPKGEDRKPYIKKPSEPQKNLTDEQIHLFLKNEVKAPVTEIKKKIVYTKDEAVDALVKGKVKSLNAPAFTTSSGEPMFVFEE